MKSINVGSILLPALVLTGCGHGFQAMRTWASGLGTSSTSSSIGAVIPNAGGATTLPDQSNALPSAGAANGGSPATTTPPASAAPLSSGSLVLLVPSANARVAANITLSGTAGSDVANVAAYSASGQKIANDYTPANGTFTLSLDTTQLDNGQTVISVIGFTSTAGQSGGQKLSIYLPLDIENAGKPAGNTAAGTTGSTPASVNAVAANAFLASLGVNIHHAQGPSIDSYVQPLIYLGVRNVRDDYANPSDFVTLHQKTGVLVDMILKNNDLPGTLAAGRTMASAGALLSFEGANEPNNFPITYNGQTGGGSGSWVPVAQFQADLYAAVKADAQLRNFPVFSPTEAGGQTDNVGLQFLTIPAGANTVMPAGTKYADFANIHNYVSSTSNGYYMDNQAWNAADPTLNAQWDALFVEFGKTWLKGFAGYSNADLQTLPRVTTETGWDSVGGPGGEAVQGTVLLNAYLAQFKRGFKYTFIYMIRDGEGGGGNQGIFNADSTPKLAAMYIHNLTTILADPSPTATPGTLSYIVANAPATVHDLLLQKGDGSFALVVWDERVSAKDNVNVTFASAPGSVKLFDPTVGPTAISTSQGAATIPLTLSNHPVVLQISK